MQELDYIDKAVVVANKNQESKILNIVAFVSLKENVTKTPFEIRKDLQKRMPEYMCPKIKIVSNFPLNSNGKCDEKKLLEEF